MVAEYPENMIPLISRAMQARLFAFSQDIITIPKNDFGPKRKEIETSPNNDSDKKKLVPTIIQIQKTSPNNDSFRKIVSTHANST